MPIFDGGTYVTYRVRFDSLQSRQSLEDAFPYAVWEQPANFTFSDWVGLQISAFKKHSQDYTMPRGEWLVHIPYIRELIDELHDSLDGKADLGDVVQ